MDYRGSLIGKRERWAVELGLGLISWAEFVIKLRSENGKSE